MDEGKFAVSVVIPVYNVESYLMHCLDTVVGQTLHNIEIICVNDGSTDSSGRVLEEFASKDKRIQIITQENKGLGKARNIGLEYATGEYIIFWDSDDYFDSDALKLMYEKAKQIDADMCICNAQDFDDRTGKKLSHNYLRKPYPDTASFNIFDCKDRIFDITSSNCWNRLVKREFMIKNEISFPEDRNIIEDEVVSMLELSLAERITVCNKKLVWYRTNREGSLMNCHAGRPDAAIEGYRECYKQLSKRGILEDEEILRSFVDRIAGLYFFFLPYYGDFKQYREYYRKTILSEDSLLRMWEDHWMPGSGAKKYLVARNLEPDEYLFQQYCELNFRLKKSCAELEGLKNELSHLIVKNI